MPFSASTCLTYTGTTQLGGVFNIYSDISGATPLQQGILLSQLTPPNCPFVIEVADGTNIIYLVDEQTGCQFTSPITSSDFCVTCDLDFDTPLSGSVGVISVGNLTGSCQNPITDYLFTWYGPDNFSLSAFTSGPSGSTFNPIFQHPLTGTSRPPVLSGAYKPVLEKIILSGITFSPSGGGGTVSANLDCFGTLTVDAYNCSNGTQQRVATQATAGQGALYDHRINYVTNYSTRTPSLSATFVLSANTNYFPYSFKGESVPDTLKITYSGVNYPTPYILEYLTMGSELTNQSLNFATSAMPKSADTSNAYARVICLTGFTNKQSGDLLILEVASNTGNTSWDFYFGCKETFDCSTCLDNFKDSSYKLSGSSIGVSSYDGIALNFSGVISGCLWTTNSSFSATSVAFDDVLTYATFGNNGEYLRTSTGGTITRTSSDMYFPGQYIRSCSISFLPTVNPPTSATTCVQNLGETITFRKTFGNILLEFTDVDDFNVYYNSYLDKMQYSGNPSNSLTPEYYRYLVLSVPAINGNVLCGDGFNYTTFNIHPSSSVSTGTTITGYSMNITLSATSFDIGNYSGANCYAFCRSTVININNTYSGSSTTYSNTNGLRRGDPFLYTVYVPVNETPPGGGATASTVTGEWSIWDYSYRTYAYSSTTASSLLNTFSAVTCDNFSSPNLTNGAGLRYKRPYSFQFRLTNSADTQNNYQVWATPIVDYNFSGYSTSVTNPASGFYELAYEISGGTLIYSNPTYII